MTIDPSCRISLEDPAGWPILIGADTQGVGVVSARCDTATAERAAEALASVLEAARDLGREWRLIGRTPGSSTGTTSRVGTYLAKRAGCWQGLEKAGVSLPSGLRQEWFVDEAQVQFAGTIDFSFAELPTALEATRGNLAIVVGLRSTMDDSVLSAISRASTQEAMLAEALTLIGNDHIVLRAAGSFGDPAVVDAFVSRDPSLRACGCTSRGLATSWRPRYRAWTAIEAAARLGDRLSNDRGVAVHSPF